MIINMNGAKAPETPSPVLQEKTVTPETLPTVIGTDEGYDGLSQVTVNPDSQLIPTNIRSGKTIFGVAGSFEGVPSPTSDVISALDQSVPKYVSNYKKSVQFTLTYGDETEQPIGSYSYITDNNVGLWFPDNTLYIRALDNPETTPSGCYVKGITIPETEIPVSYGFQLNMDDIPRGLTGRLEYTITLYINSNSIYFVNRDENGNVIPCETVNIDFVKENFQFGSYIVPDVKLVFPETAGWFIVPKYMHDSPGNTNYYVSAKVTRAYFKVTS